MFGLVTAIGAVVCGTVGGVGLISPFIGGAAAVGVSLVMKFSLVETIVLVVSCYLAPLITSSVLNEEGLSSSITAGSLAKEDEIIETDVKKKTIKAIKIGLTKVAALGLALLVPAFKIPTITGFMVLVIAVGIMWFSQGLSLDEAIPLLMNVGFQAFIWWIGLGILDIWAPNAYPIMGIIAGVSIPILLFGSTEPRKNKRELELLRQDLDREHPFRFAITGVMIVIMLMFPGYSSGALLSSLTPQDAMRSIYAAATEGFIEGWVLKLFLSNMSSAKTPLGDLLSASPLNLGTSVVLSSITGAIPLIIFTTLITCVISILLIKLITPLSLLTKDYTKIFLIFTLSLQAFATSGYFSLILLSAGFLCYLFRYFLAPLTEDSAPLALLSPML